MRWKDAQGGGAAHALRPVDSFQERHVGPSDAEVAQMLGLIGCASLADLVAQTVPSSIRRPQALDLPPARGEREALSALREIAQRNQVFRSFIGMGYYDCVTPPVIQRNILENPGWYTQYTPYQAEVAQGRLEALLNFQTMVADLTGLSLANASLLDEATAAAEAMTMCLAIAPGKRRAIFVSEECHPQTIAVIRTRAHPIGVEVHVGGVESIASLAPSLAGAVLPYPATDGRVVDLSNVIAALHAAGALAVLTTDLLALALLKSPGEMGADIAVGSSQRFGVPMGYGGPHAAFLSTKDEHRRQMPGRIVGVSHDAEGRLAYRLALQTREQHIRRDKATSNICTAQVLLAVMASMYAVYHGADGIRRIARRVHALSTALAHGLERLGFDIGTEPFFDTLTVRGLDPVRVEAIRSAVASRRMNLRFDRNGTIGVSLDEPTTIAEVQGLLEAFAGGALPFPIEDCIEGAESSYPEPLARTSAFLTHAVFNTYRSEHEMLRYIRSLEERDLSLTTSMIPLGSCTMKLNGTSEMLPVTWPEIGGLHPFAPTEQAEGYAMLATQLESWLAQITGFHAVSLQPNAGSQGEYAGLLAIHAYHRSRGEGQRDVCLIPISAHGTNPASAVMAGFRVVIVACDSLGNIDVPDLKAKAEQHKDRLGALMVTYPSTHGVFEEPIREICATVHENGGQVYMDGANMNAQVGLTAPGFIGADVCHLNLHKTFCIPHGGGGPGMGPIGVAQHLAPFLPGHPLEPVAPGRVGPVAAAPLGSPSILTIPWMYIALMGGDGLTHATRVAILNANYMAKRLEGHYDVLYTGAHGRVAHEFIVDCRAFKAKGIEVEDIAKRLMDYGFHAPTISFPVAGTMMIEPTESEAKVELDHYCDALIRIREEIRAVEEGRADATDNVLKNAPHTVHAVTANEWSHPYSREQAAFPTPWTRHRKFWPASARIDNVFGDRNLVCSCPPIEEYA
jgi:glycine dehydrogenase